MIFEFESRIFNINNMLFELMKQIESLKRDVSDIKQVSSMGPPLLPARRSLALYPSSSPPSRTAATSFSMGASEDDCEETDTNTGRKRPKLSRTGVTQRTRNPDDCLTLMVRLHLNAAFKSR